MKINRRKFFYIAIFGLGLEVSLIAVFPPPKLHTFIAVPSNLSVADHFTLVLFAQVLFFPASSVKNRNITNTYKEIKI